MLCPKCLKGELIEAQGGRLECPVCHAVIYHLPELVYPESEEEYILWQ